MKHFVTGTINGLLDLTDQLATSERDGLLSASGATKLATVRDGDSITEAYVSDAIDWVAGTAGVFVPAKAGYISLNTSARIVLMDAQGTYTTGPTCHAGNNAGHDNMLPSTAAIPTSASHAAAVASGVFPFFATTYQFQANNVPAVDMTTPALFVVAAPATGAGLVLKGRVIVQVTYVLASLLPI